MKQLWKEARGDIIGGLVVAAVLALITGLTTKYVNVGLRQLVFIILGVLWLAFGGYSTYWLIKKYKLRDKTIILIATFHHTIHNTEPHIKIHRAIEKATNDLNLDNLHVKVIPTVVAADGRVKAEALADENNASMIIWGEDTGVEIIVNFLNLKEPQLAVSEVKISETERVQLINPQAYSRFILEDLPSQLTFFTLFTIAQYYGIEGDYANAIKVMEGAINSLLPGGQPQGLVDAYFELGLFYQVSTNNYKQIITNYNKAIDLKSDLFAALVNRGTVYFLIGNHKQAISDYDHAIKLNPTEATAFSNRGAVYLYVKDYEQAITNFNQAISLDSNYAHAFANRGATYNALGEYERAIADLDQAIKLNPTLAGAYSERGLVITQKGEYERAIADFNKAIELYPDNADAFCNRGRTYHKKGEYEQAIADFNKAIELNPNNANAFYNRGLTEFEQAFTGYEQTINLDPNYVVALGAVFVHGGFVPGNEGHYEQAIADFNKAIELNPGDANAFHYRGITYQGKSEYESAIADFDQAIKLNPNLGVFCDRGRAYSAIGEYERAIADFDQVIELKPDLWIAFYYRGLAYAGIDDYKQAIADFNKAIELQPNSGDVFGIRGVAYKLIGDDERAIADFDQAIKLNPNDAKNFLARGGIYITLGKYEQGIADIDVAIELEPGDAKAWYNRACAFALQEKIEEALTDLQRALTLDGEKNSKACLELAKNDADFTSIQDDPRFRALLTKFDMKTASTGKSKKRHRAAR